MLLEKVRRFGFWEDGGSIKVGFWEKVFWGEWG